MARESIFRLGSMTKPITAAAVMMLVEEGRIALDDPIGQWLPGLASPTVFRTPASPVDDAVPAARPITELATVDVPTLVVHGDADASPPLAITGQPTADLLPTAASTSTRAPHTGSTSPHGSGWRRTCSLRPRDGVRQRIADMRANLPPHQGESRSGGAGSATTGDNRGHVAEVLRARLRERSRIGRRLSSPESVRQMITDHLI